MKLKFTLLLFLFLIVSCIFYGQGASPGSLSTDTSTVQKQPEPIHIVDINFELERTRKKLVKTSHDLKPKPQFILIDSLLLIQKAFLNMEVKEFKQFNPNNLSKYFLENTYRAWSGHESKLVKWKVGVNAKISQIENNISDLDFRKSVWELTRKQSITANDPEQLVARISKIINEIEEMKLKFMSYRREMIIREDNISDLIYIADDIQEEVSQLQQHLRDNLFVADKPSLWNVEFSTSEIFPVAPRLLKAWHENAKTVKNFSKSINYFYILLVIVLVVLLFLLLIQRFRKLDLTESDPNFVIVKRILYEHPYSALTFIILTLFVVFLTNMPLIMIGIVGTALLFFALKFLPKIVGSEGNMIVKIVLILYILNLFEIVFWYFGNYARLYITAESIVALVLIFRYGLEGTVRIRKNAPPFVKTFKVISLILFLLFSVAFFSNLFGYENMAVLTLKIGVKTAAIVVIIFSVHAILRTIILATVEVGRNSNFRVMSGHWDSFQTRSIQLINVIAFVFLVKFMFQTMEIYRSSMDWLLDFLQHEWVIGTLDISIGGILNMILILLITYALTGFVKAVIKDEFLERTNLPKGVPAAISVTIQYFIVTLGVIMALSVAGIELGEFGLLAGALGVGIGFGLQNIVNNFISGLILVYEQPVNVGDTIEVENLMGTVKRIGIRSSNVRTYDGAEVVVPNGNLISNQLINWTLSDNKRRVELKVGAAYGSDPNVILELLKKVAMDHEDVLKDPEPRALFKEFGDSSLNFRLLFWVPFEKGIGAKSDIAIGVYNIFAENNVQIPFPQVDLHVKNDGKAKTEAEEKVKKGAKKGAKAKTSPKKKSTPGPNEEPELGDDPVTGSGK